MTLSIIGPKEEYKRPKKTVPGKTIWLLWMQGWDNAPWIIQQVRKSWELLNPKWNVELVSSDNLSHTSIIWILIIQQNQILFD